MPNSNPEAQAMGHNPYAEMSVVQRFYKTTPGRLVSGLAIAGVLTAGAVHEFGGGADEAAAQAQTPQEQVSDLFSIDTVSADCIAIVHEAGTAQTKDVQSNGATLTRVFPEIGALKPFGQGGQDTRVWTDGMRNPFTTGPDQEKLATELFASFCEDPLESVTFAHELNNLVVGGVRVGDMQDEGLAWLKAFDVPADQINDKAAEMVNLNSTMTDAEVLAANKRQQDLAERLITVLQRLQNKGVINAQTLLNYHVANGNGTLSDGMPAVELNPLQMVGDMLAFEWVNKPGECIAVLAFNVTDQRPELTVCAPGTTTTIPGSTETTRPGETTTTHPGQTTTTHPGETTTTHPGETTTTSTTQPTGPKQNPHPPVAGGPSTTVAAPAPGDTAPTTTEPYVPPTTGSTIPANTSTSTTAPQGGCSDC